MSWQNFIWRHGEVFVVYWWLRGYLVEGMIVDFLSNEVDWILAYFSVTYGVEEHGLLSGWEMVIIRITHE